MNTKNHVEIVASIPTERLCSNKKDAFWEYHSPYLAVGVQILGESNVPNKLDFSGFYRFFDTKCVSERTNFRNSFQQAASCPNEARLYLLNQAVTDCLIEPREEEYLAIGATEYHLHVVSSSSSFMNYLGGIIRANDLENLSELEKAAKNNLSMMRSLDVCLATREIMACIHEMESVRS